MDELGNNEDIASFVLLVVEDSATSVVVSKSEGTLDKEVHNSELKLKK